MRKTRRQILKLVSEKLKPEVLDSQNDFPFRDGDSYVATIVVSDYFRKLGSYAVAYQHTEDGEIVYLECDPASSELSNQQEAYVLAAHQIVRSAARNAVIELQSSSTYIVDGVETSRHDWSRNGWKKTNGKPIAYPDLWKEIDTTIKDKALNVSPIHIPKSLGEKHPVFTILKSFAVTGRTMHEGDPGLDFTEESDREQSRDDQ